MYITWSRFRNFYLGIFGVLLCVNFLTVFLWYITVILLITEVIVMMWNLHIQKHPIFARGVGGGGGHHSVLHF